MEQQKKPAFGTSDFAVSAMESSDYIDVTAEESCPAESAQADERHAATETPSVASREVMDQLKALAQNVTQGSRASFDESKAAPVQSGKSEDADASDHGGSHAPEPSISVFPRPSGFENSQPVDGRSRSGKVLAVAGFVMAAVTGAGATFAWQAHNKPAEVATAAPAPAAAVPIIAPYLGRQLEDLAQDISSVRARMEELAAKQQQLATAQQQLAAVQQQLDQLAAKQQQLAAKQEQAGQSIGKLHALEQARQRTPAPIQTRAAPAPPQPYVPAPPIEPAMQPPPPPPPRTAAHPIPPLPVPQ